MGAFVKRELIVSLRRGRAYSDRMAGVLSTTAVIAGCVLAWWWQGWDRMSASGAATFALTMFWAIVLVQALVATGLVLGQVGPAIASERDRKSLDALLATRLSSAGIVLGTMATGLVRAANGLGAALPVVVVMLVVLRIDDRLAWLVGAGLVSMAIFLASLAVAGSAVARNRAHSFALTVLLVDSWLALPLVILIVRSRFGWQWPGWIMEAVLWLLDSSPIGLVANLAGVYRRPGGIAEAIGRMVALQAAGSVLVVGWTIWRLRPASRAVYDHEGRTAFRRLMATLWRRPRTPCGDDPVLWNAIQSSRAVSWYEYVFEKIAALAAIGLLAVGTWWFATPAFAELRERGYGPMAEAFALPESNPFARELVGKVSGLSTGAATGQARLEFNIALRLVSASLLLLYTTMIVSNAAACIVSERERDTWLGLIATPLDGWEILRGKMLGALWRARTVALSLVALWTIGLIAGSVHPLGFLAALVSLAVLSGFFASFGVAVSLRTENRKAPEGLGLALILFVSPLGAMAILFPGTASVLWGATSGCFLTWLALFSHEDIHTIIHSGIFPQFAGSGSPKPGVGARLALATWVIGIAAHGVLACWVARASLRDFDRIIGRPMRARPDDGRS